MTAPPHQFKPGDWVVYRGWPAEKRVLTSVREDGKLSVYDPDGFVWGGMHSYSYKPHPGAEELRRQYPLDKLRKMHGFPDDHDIPDDYPGSEVNADNIKTGDWVRLKPDVEIPGVGHVHPDDVEGTFQAQEVFAGAVALAGLRYETGAAQGWSLHFDQVVRADPPEAASAETAEVDDTRTIEPGELYRVKEISAYFIVVEDNGDETFKVLRESIDVDHRSRVIAYDVSRFFIDTCCERVTGTVDRPHRVGQLACSRLGRVSIVTEYMPHSGGHAGVYQCKTIGRVTSNARQLHGPIAERPNLSSLRWTWNKLHKGWQPEYRYEADTEATTETSAPDTSTAEEPKTLAAKVPKDTISTISDIVLKEATARYAQNLTEQQSEFLHQLREMRDAQAAVEGSVPSWKDFAPYTPDNLIIFAGSTAMTLTPITTPTPTTDTEKPMTTDKKTLAEKFTTTVRFTDRTDAAAFGLQLGAVSASQDEALRLLKGKFPDIARFLDANPAAESALKAALPMLVGIGASYLRQRALEKICEENDWRFDVAQRQVLDNPGNDLRKALKNSPLYRASHAIATTADLLTVVNAQDLGRDFVGYLLEQGRELLQFALTMMQVQEADAKVVGRLLTEDLSSSLNEAMAPAAAEVVS